MRGQCHLIRSSLGRPGATGGNLPHAVQAAANTTPSPPPGTNPYYTSQYTAASYQQALGRRGLICSMSRSGECLDNAMAERFFATLKAERIHTRAWPTGAAARTAIFAWVEVFYNRQRAHSALAYQPPAIFEEVVLLSCPAA